MADTKFLNYKEKPLVRKGNEIYYGDMTEAFVIRFEILSTVKDGEIDIPNKVSVQLLKNDIDISEKDKIVKETTKSSMYDALDFGFTWLERALKD